MGKILPLLRVTTEQKAYTGANILKYIERSESRLSIEFDIEQTLKIASTYFLLELKPRFSPSGAGDICVERNRGEENRSKGKEKQIRRKEKEEVRNVLEEQQAEQVDLEYRVGVHLNSTALLSKARTNIGSGISSRVQCLNYTSLITYKALSKIPYLRSPLAGHRTKLRERNLNGKVNIAILQQNAALQQGMGSCESRFKSKLRCCQCS